MRNTAEALSAHEGELWQRIDDARIRCLACGHRCPIFEGLSGVCKVRFNRGGKLYVPWGYVAALQRDPIEKKPFFHVLPGTRAMSFGMLGCNLHCGYCQNWLTSQAFKDARAIVSTRSIEPQQIVEAAVRAGARAVISTYNEPLITPEWAADVFRHAHRAGLITGVVSNGNATPEVLDYLRPCTDLYKVDLKAFRDGTYRRLGGRLAPVLDSIRKIHEKGFWLEVVTLIVPELNDSDEELRGCAQFLAGVSPDIPWHVTAFHDDYKMTDRGGTTASALTRAVAIGRAAGLRYVYAGNAPGLNGFENTFCAHCDRLLVARSGFRVKVHQLTASGACSGCGAIVPGLWSRESRCHAVSFRSPNFSIR